MSVTSSLQINSDKGMPNHRTREKIVSGAPKALNEPSSSQAHHESANYSTEEVECMQIWINSFPKKLKEQLSVKKERTEKLAILIRQIEEEYSKKLENMMAFREVLLQITESFKCPQSILLPSPAHSHFLERIESLKQENNLTQITLDEVIDSIDVYNVHEDLKTLSICTDLLYKSPLYSKDLEYTLADVEMKDESTLEHLFKLDLSILRKNLENFPVVCYEPCSLFTLSEHTSTVCSLSLSLNHKQFASGSGDKSIKIWGTKTGELQKTLEGHSGYVLAVAYSPRTMCLASGSEDSSIRLWNSETDDYSVLIGHSAAVLSLAFSPCGKFLASGSQDQTIKKWSVSGKEELMTLEGHSGVVSSLAFSPYGQFIASGSADKTVRIWRAQNGMNTKTFEGHSKGVRSVVFSACGKFVVSGSQDSNAIVWILETGIPLFHLQGHSKAVRAVACSQHLVVTASSDKSIKVWKIENGECIKRISGHSPVNCVALTEKYIIAGCKNAQIQVWKIK